MARIRSVLALAVAPALALRINFSFYPTNAQACLYKAADGAGCSGDYDNVTGLNTCLCGTLGDNGGFVTESAKCLGQNDMPDVEAVYRTMERACINSKTPLGVSQAEFVSTAAAAAATGGGQSGGFGRSNTTGPETTVTVSTTAVVTWSPGPVTAGTAASATMTVAPAADPNSSGSSRLSAGATIGIAVGASVGGVGALAAASLLLYRRRRRKRRADEAPCPPYWQSPAKSKVLAPYDSPYGSPVQQRPGGPAAVEIDGAGMPAVAEVAGSEPPARQ